MGTAAASRDWGLASVFARKYPLVAKAAPFLLWVLALAAVRQVLVHLLTDGTWGQDSHAYWLAAQEPLEYGRIPGQKDAYLYSPAFVYAIKPLALLPWPAFSAVWTLLIAALAFWLVRPLPVRFAVPVSLICLSELVVGNIYLMLGAAAVLAVRAPEAWAFPILTKITTGVGVLRDVARRDWKAVARAVGATAAIVLVAAAFRPHAWTDWISFLLENRDETPDSTASFYLRCAAAIALSLFAARKGWAFLLAPAVMLAAPVFTGPLPLMTLVAVPRLLLLDPPPRSAALDGAAAEGPAAGAHPEARGPQGTEGS
ncbi:glycosyltransferase family 87 protein [Sinomonas halotolerans]|uniref:Glycosyltransferase family 87 protein n=1 Tax=Sinomonas halotolerans TaxID=1644133 RepID=A0ABU9WYI9_9MICC